MASRRAALLDAGITGFTDSGESEDFGISWTDRRTLQELGGRGVLDVVDGVLVARPPFMVRWFDRRQHFTRRR